MNPTVGALTPNRLANDRQVSPPAAYSRRISRTWASLNLFDARFTPLHSRPFAIMSAMFSACVASKQ
jgi:hypothetical protein